MINLLRYLCNQLIIEIFHHTDRKYKTRHQANLVKYESELKYSAYRPNVLALC